MRLLTATLLTLCLSHFVTAQSSDTKVILINGVATEVVLSGSGDIVSTLNIKNDYMNGYEKLPAILSRPMVVTPVFKTTFKIETSNTGNIKFDSSYANVDNKDKRTVIESSDIK